MNMDFPHDRFGGSLDRISGELRTLEFEVMLAIASMQRLGRGTGAGWGRLAESGDLPPGSDIQRRISTLVDGVNADSDDGAACGSFSPRIFKQLNANAAESTKGESPVYSNGSANLKCLHLTDIVTQDAWVNAEAATADRGQQ